LDANIVVILISLTLFIAYLSGILFTLTRVPDMVWMISFGILLGPVLGLFKAGARVYKGQGFEVEGHLRMTHFNKVLNKYCDEYRMGLLLD
jgi:Kef-type K+ transport system membrane component KefB